jgi:arginyl-tRNA synthetase
MMFKKSYEVAVCNIISASSDVTLPSPFISASLTAATSPEKATTFDWESALDFDKLGAPFIQYSHARACSILRKAQYIPESIDPARLLEDVEISFVKELARFSYVIDLASRELKPHIVAIYARELAEEFNQFYRLSPVLSAPDDVRDARIGLVECARIVLASTLGVLGIAAPESM